MRAHPGLPARPGQRGADPALQPDASRSPHRRAGKPALNGAIAAESGPVRSHQMMAIAALVAWVFTASIGVYMLRTWVARGGLRRQRATGVGVPPAVVFGHASAALTGLAIWIGFVKTRWDPLAWLGVALITAAIALGVCTVTLWTPYPVVVPAEMSAQEGPGGQGG